MSRTTLACLLLLCACGGRVRLYEGPALPGSEVARVRVWDEGGVDGGPGEETYDVWITMVDGRALDKRTKRIELLPGPHTLEVSWIRYEVPLRAQWRESLRGIPLETHRGKLLLELEAEAGKSYVNEWRHFDGIGEMVLRETGSRG